MSLGMMHSAPKRHELKTWLEPFQAVWDRKKTAEFRLNDRGFEVGHELLLREWDDPAQEYRQRYILVTITDIRRGEMFGIPRGYVMLSFRPEWRGNDGGMTPM